MPLIQSEEDGGDMKGDKDAEPHGPVERPHEGTNGCSCVTSANLGKRVTQDWKSFITDIIEVRNLCPCQILLPIFTGCSCKD